MVPAPLNTFEITVYGAVKGLTGQSCLQVNNLVTNYMSHLVLFTLILFFFF